MPFVSQRPALELTEEELEYVNRVSKSRTLPESAVERVRRSFKKRQTAKNILRRDNMDYVSYLFKTLDYGYSYEL